VTADDDAAVPQPLVGEPEQDAAVVVTVDDEDADADADAVFAAFCFLVRVLQ
jgi:hypothetical protein